MTVGAENRRAVAVPRGACDCHAHVFGPASRFPYAEPRSYTPEDAPFDTYVAMLDRLGFDRGVVVHPSAYGRDNGATLDAIRRAPDRLRGVAVLGSEATPELLRQYHEAGFRGLRVNEFRRDGKPVYQNTVPLAEIEPFLPMLAEMGWHVQLWMDTRDLPDMLPRLLSMPVPFVIDHMGRIEHHHGPQHPGFQALLRGVGEGRLWCKLSGAYRLTHNAPDYPEARPFHEALLRANPDNLVWGTDWPHPRPEGPTPDPLRLRDLFLDWTPAALHRRILVDNPTRLYGFPSLS